MTFTPWHFTIVAIGGWMNRQQQEVIAYLQEENRILREKLGGKRLLLSAEQKRRLAVRGKALGRRLLQQFGTLFSPDTLLRWHRWLIARKYDGLTRYLVFFVMELATRKVEIVGVHADPCEAQMLQWARNLTDAEDGFLTGKRILIHDRDPLFTKKFQDTLKAGGVRCLRLPRWSPNLNAHCEAWVRAIKSECLNMMILFGEAHVRHVVSEYVEHYLTERPHRVLGHRVVEDQPPMPREGPVLCRERLGGLLKTYYREAA